VIGLDFIAKGDPGTRRYDPRPSQNPPGGARPRPTILTIVREILVDLLSPGVKGSNRLVPDLTDYKLHEIYEIKPDDAKGIQNGLDGLDRTLTALNSTGDMIPWIAGIDYTTFPRIIPLDSNTTAETRMPSPGLIVYDIIQDNKNNGSTATVISGITLAVVTLYMAYIAIELASDIARRGALGRGFA
jgi:hypothetical protein